MPFTIQRADSVDSEEIALLVRRSITELCEEDHQNDPKTLKLWLENKTAANVEAWIVSAGCFLVAVDHNRRILGAAFASSDGHIFLNYVLPEMRFVLVSKMLMRTFEVCFAERGLKRFSLTGTKTAARFFRSLGYRETGDVEKCFGLAFPMFTKALC